MMSRYDIVHHRSAGEPIYEISQSHHDEIFGMPLADRVDDRHRELVLSLRRLGLLHRLTRVLADADLDVTHARVATIGQEVIDAFYVVRHDGSRLDGDVTDLVGALEAAITT